MKNQLLLLSLISLIALMSSCKALKYQVTTMESSSVNNQFEFENDDLILDYNFWDFGGDLGFTITNKTDEPIFIDWEHSNFVFNGYSYDYFNNEESMSLTSVGVYEGKSVSGLVDLDYSISSVTPGVRKNSTATRITNSSGTIRREKRNVQIPPQSYLQARVVNLDFPWLKMKGDDVKFSKSNSPLNVRTYIGYSRTKDLAELEYIDNEFYVDNVTETKPRNARKMQSKNKFFTSKKKFSFIKTIVGTGVTIGALIVAGLLSE